MNEKCNNYEEITCFDDMCTLCDDRFASLLLASKELLEDYVEEHGGDMPTNDDHPAHAVRKALEAFDERNKD